MPDLFLDSILIVSYISYAAYCRYIGSKEQGSLSLGCLKGALSLFLVAWLMIAITMAGDYFLSVKIIPTYIFHIILTFGCLSWSRYMVKYHNAVYPAIAILLFAILQAIYAIDWFLYNSAPTELGRIFTTLAIFSHATILIATHVNGLTLHTIACRRDHRGVKPL